jgi:probable phosphoglycerate mutase
MRLFVTRHGQTTWNVQNKICGRTDVPLTELGKQQAAALAAKTAHVGIDLIIASPLQRALDTAKAVASVCGAPIVTDDRLIEQDYGIYEGKDRKDPGFQANKRLFVFRYPHGESMMQLAGRVYGLLEDVKKQYADKTVLLVCHNGICRVIHSYFHDMTNEEFATFSMDNAALAEYEL